jgi:hypothetical protein
MFAAVPDGRLAGTLRWLRARNRVWLVLSWIALAAGVVIVCRHGTDAGAAWDETFHLRYGKRVLAWFRTDHVDTGALNYKNLYLYGGLFDFTAAWLTERSPLGPYETRHLLTAFVALLGVVGCWKLASLVAGPAAGVLAATMLVLTPAWVGHGLFNPKDIPFGTGAIWAAYTATRLGSGPIPPRLRDIFWAGIALGLALAVRPGGMILVSYPFIAVSARAAVELRRRLQRQQPLRFFRLLANSAWKVVVVLVLAYPLMLMTWPWAQLAPFERPFEALRAAMHFTWNGLVLFRGEFIHAHDLPRSYLPVWFAITLPETYVLAAICALACLWRFASDRRFVKGERVIGTMMIALATFMPLMAAIVLRPPVYDGQRHFLFILPPLAALAGVTFASFFRAYDWPIRLRRSVAGIWIALCIVTYIDMRQLHPYEYIYFNRLSGGLKAADGRFETDYWGVAYKEAFAWVVRHVPPVHPERRTRIASCNTNTNERMTYYLEQSSKAKAAFEVVKSYQRADLYVAMTRGGCHRVPGEVLRTIKRQGVPLVYVIRTTNN